MLIPVFSCRSLKTHTMKKINLVLFKTSFLLIFCSVFTADMYAQSGTTFKQWGEETITRIKADLFKPASGLYNEGLAANQQVPSYIWPGGIMFHALIAAGKITEAENYANTIHVRYSCTRNGIWGYDASAGGCGDRFYDDNAWIAKGLMELHKATSNATYLNRAREVIAFSMSGQNANGSIKFQEGNAEGSTCICASAPTSVSNLMIYQATNIQKYKDDGLRIYNYMKSQGWKVGPGYRGYENAVACQAAMLLYKITGEATYRNDAVQLGLQMETFYVNWATHALHETGQWGGHDMTNAYVELYQMDGDINWLNIAAGYLQYLHDNCKDANGRYPENWNDLSGGNPMLLYQASAARGFAKMGTTAGGQAKYPDPAAVFADCNFSGHQDAGLFIGRYTTADLTFLGIQNKGISSVKVQPGYKLTLFDTDNFTGKSLELTADNACLTGTAWNDHVGSLIVETVAPLAVLYKDADYTGRAIGLPVGSYTLAQLQQRAINDNDITSLSVPEGYTVTVYENDNFTGASKAFTATSNWLADWNDRISSVKITSATGIVTVFQDVDWGGYTAGLATGDYKLVDLLARGIKDNDITSVKVSEGFKIILYFDDNFTGTSTTITANSNFINNFNDQVTSLRVLPNGNPNLTGTYYIKNNASGLTVDLANADLTNGGIIRQWDYNGSDAQKFKLVHVGDGNYTVVSVASNKVWDVSGVSYEAGTSIIQRDNANGKNQHFILVNAGNGLVKMIAEHTGMVAEVSTNTAGEALHQWWNAGQANSKWSLVPVVTTSLNEEAFAANTFTVKPNPAHDYLSLSSDHKLQDGSISITDVAGKTVLVIHEYKGEEINIGNLSVGVYIITFRNSNINTRSKFVKY